MNGGSVSLPLDPCRVEIPTWSSAEFKVPREHRRSCEMIGFRSADHSNDYSSVEPLLSRCTASCAHTLHFCIRDRQCDLTDQPCETYFSNSLPFLSRLKSRRLAMASNRTRNNKQEKLVTFNSTDFRCNRSFKKRERRCFY